MVLVARTGLIGLLASVLVVASVCPVRAVQLGCDAPVTRNFTTNTQVDSFDLGFDVTQNETVAVRLVRLSTVSGFFNPVFTMVDRFGQPVADADCQSRSGRRDCGPLPASGNPYRLQVSNSNSGIGSYGLQVQRLGATCSGASLACDTPVTGDISDALDTDVFELGFAVIENEVLLIRIAEITTTSGSFNVHWRLLDRTGAPVADTDCRSDARGSEDCGPLPINGNPYRIEVQDPEANGAGTYKVYVQRQTAAAACESSTVPCDGTRTEEISDPFEFDLVGLGFPVVEGEIVLVSVLRSSSNGSFQPSWRLLDGRGIPVTDSDCNNSETGPSDCGPLPASGNPYRVHVFDAQADGSGAFTVYTQRLTAPHACENRPACRLDPPFERDLLTFDANGDAVTVTVTEGTTLSGSFSPSWRLIDGKGFPVADLDCNDEGAGVRTCGPLPTFGNPYRIEMREFQTDGTGTYDVKINGVSLCTVCSPGAPCCSASGSFLAAGTVCRGAAGPCDVSETCSGTSASCPADAKSTAVCRSAQGTCDVAESCDGVSASCPSDTKAPDGTSCADALFCDGAETCQAGTCHEQSGPCGPGTCNEATDTCPLPCTATVAIGSNGVFDDTELCTTVTLDNRVGVRGLEGVVTSDLAFSRIECGDRNPSFACSANQTGSGSVRFNVLDLGGGCLSPGSGSVARLCFTRTDQVCRDTDKVAITLQSVTAGDCSNAVIPSVCMTSGNVGCIELGDCEVDRDVDLFDILHMIDLVLERESPSGAERTACDTDCDGTLDIFDIFRLIDVLLEIRPRPLQCPVTGTSTAAALSSTAPDDATADSKESVPSQPFELRRRGSNYVVRVKNDRPLRGIELTLTPTDGPVEIREVRASRRAHGLTTEHRQSDASAPVRILMTAFDDGRVKAGQGTIVTIKTARRAGAGHLTLTEVKAVQ